MPTGGRCGGDGSAVAHVPEGGDRVHRHDVALEEPGLHEGGAATLVDDPALDLERRTHDGLEVVGRVAPRGLAAARGEVGSPRRV